MNTISLLWNDFFTPPPHVSRRFFRAALLTSLFGLPAHMIFLGVFAAVGELEMAYINVGSIIIWLGAIFLAKSGRVLGGLLLNPSCHLLFVVSC